MLKPLRRISRSRNAMAFLDSVEPAEKRSSGVSLRNKYAPSFERFVNNHGTSVNIFNQGRLCRRQKTRLRDALVHLEANKDGHKLQNLWNALRFVFSLLGKSLTSCEIN